MIEGQGENRRRSEIESGRQCMTVHDRTWSGRDNNMEMDSYFFSGDRKRDWMVIESIACDSIVSLKAESRGFGCTVE